MDNNSASSQEQVSYFNEAGRGKTLLHVINLARFNPGVIGLMGDEGSGRSRLAEKMVERVNQKQGFAVVITRSVKTRNDLHETMKECLSIENTEGEKPGYTAQRIDDFLQVTAAQYRPVIIAIDDVQRFSLAMLEELIGMIAKHKRISLLLLGDRHLGEMIRHLDTADLSCHTVTLEALSEGEVRQFLNWRLPEQSINSEEFERIVSSCKGNLALLEQAAEKLHQQKGRKSGSYKMSIAFNAPSRKILFILLLFLLIAVIGAGGVYYWQQQQESARVVASAVVSNDSVEPEITEPVAEPAPVVEQPLEPVAVSDIEPAAGVAPVSEPPVVEVAIVQPVEASKPVEADDAGLLLALPAKSYSIQVLGAQTAKKARKFIVDHPDLAPLYFFRSTRDGKDWYIVTYGVYDSRQQAIDATTKLPDDIKSTSPWARRLSEIHGLINARVTP